MSTTVVVVAAEAAIVKAAARAARGVRMPHHAPGGPPGRVKIPALGAVAQLFHTLVLGAMVAAEHAPVLLQAVPDDPGAAVRAGGCQRLDRAFEAVEGVGLPGHHHLEGLVVIVTAAFASRHRRLR